MINLYDHQGRLIRDASAGYAAGRKNVLIQSATGSGKSVIASEILRRAVLKGHNTWFVVPRVELMRQMSVTFGCFDIAHSYIASGYQYMDILKAHICTLQTLTGRMGKITPPQFIVIDETHWGGQSVADVIAYARSIGAFVLGLSATPARSDNFGMGDWYDTMVCGPSISWLIDNKYLSKYRLIQPETGASRGEQITHHVDSWQKYSEGRKTIVYARDIAHSKRVVEDFKAAGIRAAHMDALTQDDERRSIITKFADGELDIISNVFLLTFGFDLASQVGRPVNVRCILDLALTGSLTSQMQKNGRALRYDPAGDAVIIDLAGNTLSHNHGFPCSDRRWTLDTSDQHKRDVEDRERMIRTVLCKTCFMPSKLGPLQCPHCGAGFTADGKHIRIIEGQLVEITPEQLRQEEDEQRRRARMEQGMAKDKAALVKQQMSRGMSRHKAEYRADIILAARKKKENGHKKT